MQRPLVELWPVWYNKWGHHPSPWAEGVFRCQWWLCWGSFPWHSAASVCSCCAGAGVRLWGCSGVLGTSCTS